MLRVEVNGSVVRVKRRSTGAYFRVKNADSVEIFFEPWRIEPRIRFGHHLVNYGVAGINQWDHKLDFVYSDAWDYAYFEQILEHKRQYIGQTGVKDLNYDAYLGVDSFHWDIVERIRSKL